MWERLNSSVHKNVAVFYADKIDQNSGLQNTTIRFYGFVRPAELKLMNLCGKCASFTIPVLPTACLRLSWFVLKHKKEKCDVFTISAIKTNMAAVRGFVFNVSKNSYSLTWLLALIQFIVPSAGG